MGQIVLLNGVFLISITIAALQYTRSIRPLRSQSILELQARSRARLFALIWASFAFMAFYMLTLISIDRWV